MDSILNPYLIFNGNAAEAMKFYHSVLGGELNMQTFEEAKVAKTPEEKNRVVHARLNSEGVVLMASDGMTDRGVKFGENISLSLMGSDEARLREAFRRLSDGGNVTMPLAKQFWGDTYGQLTDKYGVHWMVNISAPPAKT